MRFVRRARRAAVLPAAAALAAATLLATATGAQAVPTGSVTGYQIVQGASTAITPGTSAAASVSCSAGQVVLDGGVSAHSPLTFIVSSYPSASDAWSVTMTDTGNETYTEHFTPYAVCVDASSVPGIQIVSANQTVGGNSTELTGAYCGTDVVGGGVATSSTSVFLTISQPEPGYWLADVHNTGGSTASFTVYSVCIPSADVSVYQTGSASYGAYGTFVGLIGSPPGAQAAAVPPAVFDTAGSPYCPSGTVAVAGGVFSHDQTNAYISSVYPNSSGRYWLVTETDVSPPQYYNEFFLPNDVCVSSSQPTSLTAWPQYAVGQPGHPDSGVGFGVVAATLTSNGSPVSGEQVSFSVGTHSLCTAVTNSSGVASCHLGFGQELQVIFANHYSASFAGDGSYQPSSANTQAVVFAH